MAMPTIEEMTAWAPREIEAAIRSNLPPGVSFSCGHDRGSGVWFVRFWQEHEGKQVTLYEDFGFEQRITYFNGYGWVWARQKPKTASTSPWKPRDREVTPNVRTAKTRSPLPDDLDPAEVKAVYERFREQPKKRR